ncbi:MAG: hypothetical protein M5U14_00445 [Acidimicrobiia bacterium]|nr:hypothetical protein [Acidimicrobiia bacterium]
MSDAGFVAAGWALTGGALALYWLRLAVRTRRAERSLPPADREAT